jgi:hypothetical protein
MIKSMIYHRSLFAGIVSLFCAAVPVAQADETVPKFTVGEAQFIPVTGKRTWFMNDSAFPFLPDAAGKGKIAFWGDGEVIRYAGPDIEHMAPSDPGDKDVEVTDAPGTKSTWHRNGGWMLTATRLADGTLVAFVHGEDHKFDDTKYGEWNSTGVWISNDDGVSWVDEGEVVGSRKPEKHIFGGLALNECLWDAPNKRWLGYAGPYAFISTDPHALPGTWLGYHDGDFTQPIDVDAPKLPLTPAPGLEHSGVKWGGLTYNTYLKQFIMTWDWGTSVRATFSSDGIHWSPVVTLFDDSDAPGALGDDISYAFIVGDTDTRCGQDCYLVYMNHPPGKTISKNRKDMMRRPIHFELPTSTAPASTSA